MSKDELTSVIGEKSPEPLVLHVIPTAKARGAQREARALADELDLPGTRRHKLMSLLEGPEEIAVDLRVGFHARHDSPQGFDPRLVVKLRRRVRELKPSLIVAHGGDPLKYLAPAMIGWEIPLVYYAIGTFAGSTASRAQVQLWRHLVKRTALIAAEGPEVQEQCISLFGLPAEHVTLVINGRDPEEFRPRNDGTGIAASPVPTLLFVGAFTTGKRPGRFIEVVRRLRESGVSFRAVMAGDGPLFEDLKVEAGVAGIEILGSRSDVADILRTADVMIFPSLPTGEGLPGVLIEAGLSGVPVVATDVPGVATIVEDGGTGFVVDPDDFEGMVTKVQDLLQDQDLRTTFALAARRHCSKKFSMHAVGECWQSFLLPLLPADQKR